MTDLAPSQSKPSSWQIAVGAEGIAAAQFARCGFDVSVQSGADKPRYDLVVTNAGNLLKVSVKGSGDGRWDLTQTYLKRASERSGKKTDHHGAIDLWLDNHGSRTVCCLVQFEGVAIDQLPRIYLASPAEIAHVLHETADRLGDSVLYEKYGWTSANGSSEFERLPSSWGFSNQRIQQLLTGRAAETPSGAGSSSGHKAHSRITATVGPAPERLELERRSAVGLGL